MVDYIDADGNLYIDKDTKPVTGSRVTDEAELEIKITDEGSKVNINFADGTRLKKVLDYVGIPPDSQQEIVDSILD